MRSFIVMVYLIVNELIVIVELVMNCRNVGLGVLGRGNEKDWIF